MVVHTLAVGMTSVRCTASPDSTVGKLVQDVRGAQCAGCTEHATCTEHKAYTGRTVKVYSTYRVSMIYEVCTVRGDSGCMVVVLGSGEFTNKILVPHMQ